jgi:hypothetical protein
MGAPRFENVLSMGNIIQIGVILFAMAIAWGDARGDITMLKNGQNDSIQQRAQIEIRLRAMEIATSRSDERIDNLLRSMDELKQVQRETNALLRQMSK